MLRSSRSQGRSDAAIATKSVLEATKNLFIGLPGIVLVVDLPPYLPAGFYQFIKGNPSCLQPLGDIVQQIHDRRFFRANEQSLFSFFEDNGIPFFRL